VNGTFTETTEEAPMPNWVHNTLIITADDETIAETRNLLAESDETPVTFQKLVPRPPEEDDNWYTWNVANWGTKWDARGASLERDPGVLRYSFETAWSPPMPVIGALATAFPTLSFTFSYEEEQGWGGWITVSNGIVTASDDYEAPESHADIEARGGTCLCEHRPEQRFNDCYSYRAAQVRGISAETLEAVNVLGRHWHGTFEELLEASHSL
jgi:hypothetical protein